MHALIVGGGIGGLTAALCCLREGIEVTLIEQASALREIGAGVQISSNGSTVLRELGVLDKVAEVAIKPISFRILSFDTGELISDMPLGIAAAKRYGHTFYQIHRADLLDILAAALPKGVLRLGSRVEGFTQDADGVAVTLKSGETIRGDVLIGADGIHSVIRRNLVGQQDTAFSGKLSWRALVPADRIAECDFKHRFYGWAGGDRMVFAYWVRPGKLFNFGGVVPATEVMRESWSQTGDVAELKRSFAGATPRLAKLVDAIDEASITGLYYKDPLTTWTEGRVTLLGDAAHAMLPYLAQGACQSLEDAMVVAKCLARHGDRGIPAALAEYELKRRPRTTKVQSTARATSIFWLEKDAVRVAARNGRMRGLQQIDPLATSVWGWLYSYDACKDGSSEFIIPQKRGKKREYAEDGPEQRRAWDMWHDLFTAEDEARGVAGLREGYDRFFGQFTPSVTTQVTEVKAGFAPGLWVDPEGSRERPIVLHFHGGGFAFGSAKCSVEYCERLAEAIGGRCLALEYRLAPENPFPAPLEDALAAYRWLLTEGYLPSEILLSGESAGGGLAVAVAMALRDAGDPLPAGIIALSPFADGTLQSESIDRYAGQDPIIDRDILTYMVTNYFQSHSAVDPLVSPLYGDFSGLPPFLIQAGRTEVLVDDAVRLAAAAKEKGVDVTLELYDERLHIFSQFPFLPNAAKALASVQAFARKRFGSDAKPARRKGAPRAASSAR
jgi:salicylate hydroxylase